VRAGGARFEGEAREADRPQRAAQPAGGQSW
jgi:hypothetical protein